MQLESSAAESCARPLLPLRDYVMFPRVTMPLFVGLAMSVRAIETAMKGDKKIVLVALKDAYSNSREPDAVYTMGTLAEIVSALKLPDGTLKVSLAGIERVRVDRIANSDGYQTIVVHPISSAEAPAPEDQQQIFQRIIALAPLLRTILGLETFKSLAHVNETGPLADLIASRLKESAKTLQMLLETPDSWQRLRQVLEIVDQSRGGAVDLAEAIEQAARMIVERQNAQK